ncbi:fumarate hydratase [Pedobacter sp. MW01-1-1]|uniref:fumarate hydratase n=1 Tax=Pedobacter sp. MW01-1-1 TaxID=3383027 RepID=UPI003FF10145
MLSLSACAPRANIQGEGDIRMQGLWNQDSVPYSKQLSNYTQYRFKFSCDSFYLDLETHSKVNYYEDSCYNKGIWKEYVKGVYAVKGDTLFLGGTYTKANYKQKISGCYHIGQYTQNFVLKKTAANRLLLKNLSDQREIDLTLKKKVICTPKEL